MCTRNKVSNNYLKSQHPRITLQLKYRVELYKKEIVKQTTPVALPPRLTAGDNGCVATKIQHEILRIPSPTKTR